MFPPPIKPCTKRVEFDIIYQKRGDNLLDNDENNILITTDSWLKNLIWVSETKKYEVPRNVTVAIKNTSASVNTKRLYKRYFNSLYALSHTDEFASLADENDDFEFFKDVFHLFQNEDWQNINSNQFNPSLYDLDKFFDVPVPAVKFVLYFMSSFYNLNSLASDFLKIHKKTDENNFTTWTKEDYINQTISEIYREDFLLTMLLEVLALSIKNSKTDTKITVKKIVSIYNSYLEPKTNDVETVNSEHFSYQYYWETQYYKELEKDPEIPKWFGESIWNKSMEGKLIIKESRKKTRSTEVANFTIPSDFSNLQIEEYIKAFNMILQLFILNANYEKVADNLNERQDYFPTETKYQIQTLKNAGAELSIARIADFSFYERENEFNHAQYIRTLFQATPDDNKQTHFILNPKIPELVACISKELKDHDDYTDISYIHFQQILT